MPGDSIRERLSALSRNELVGVIAVVVVTVGGAGLWYARSLPKPVAVAGPASASPAAVEGASATPAAPMILVDVAGWVRRPGVYEFHEGDRVIDAIEAAGGTRRGALLSSLNLAAPLADGSQILVPKEGATGVIPGAPPPTGDVPGSLVNVNTADAAGLETLPGVGEVIAQAIIDYRTENGPFTTVEELLDVTGIGDATLENIRDLVTI